MPFPFDIYSQATLIDGVDSVLAAHQNTPNLELTTIETWLLNKAELGWIPVNESWSYASASTITVPTDATTKYQKWDRIRLKQGGAYKYYTIQSLTSTVLTIVTNTDYVVANSAITDIYISRSILPFGFPTSFNWTPAPTNFTLGNGTLTAKYFVSGGWVDYQLNFLFGSTSAISGDFTFTAPIPPAFVNTRSPSGIGVILDAATANYSAAVICPTSTTFAVRANTVTGSNVSQSVLSSTLPMTWATNDELNLLGRYRAT